MIFVISVAAIILAGIYGAFNANKISNPIKDIVLKMKQAEDGDLTVKSEYSGNDEIGDFIYDITRFYVDFHWEQERTLGCVINDPLAVEFFINRDICEGFKAYVDIACEDISMGQSVVDVADFYKRRKNVFVLDKVNSKEFMVSFLNKIFPSHKEDIENILNNPKYGI